MAMIGTRQLAAIAATIARDHGLKKGTFYFSWKTRMSLFLPPFSAPERMMYIGQSFGSREIEFGDTGLVYFFFSERTLETKVVMQCF